MPVKSLEELKQRLQEPTLFDVVLTIFALNPNGRFARFPNGQIYHHFFREVIQRPASTPLSRFWREVGFDSYGISPEIEQALTLVKFSGCVWWTEFGEHSAFYTFNTPADGLGRDPRFRHPTHDDVLRESRRIFSQEEFSALKELGREWIEWERRSIELEQQWDARRRRRAWPSS